MSDAVFTKPELERYARHIILDDVGGIGQQKLKRAKVLIIGAGGLGAPALQYLAAAGVGTLGIIDDDVVSLSNLQRQIIHSTDNVGKQKVESAKAAILAINPHVNVLTFNERLNEENAKAIVAQFDLVLDGCDNFDTRYLVAEICESAKVPLITAAIGKFDGSITTLKPYGSNAAGEQNPRYTDVFPSKPPEGLLPNCAEVGVVGALTGVLGSMQALEAIKEIVDIGDGLVGTLLLYDGKSCDFQRIKYRRKSNA